MLSGMQVAFSSAEAWITSRPRRREARFSLKEPSCSSTMWFCYTCGLEMTRSRWGMQVMKNPWMKRNPFLSMWLSGANAVVGATRGRMTAEARRQMVTFWSAALTPQKPKKRRTRR
jgi:hypothetical protein